MLHELNINFLKQFKTWGRHLFPFHYNPGVQTYKGEVSIRTEGGEGSSHVIPDKLKHGSSL